MKMGANLIVIFAVIILTIVGIYTATDLAVDSTDEEVNGYENSIDECLTSNTDASNCELFGSSEEEEGSVVS